MASMMCIGEYEYSDTDNLVLYPVTQFSNALQFPKGLRLQMSQSARFAWPMGFGGNTRGRVLMNLCGEFEICHETNSIHIFGNCVIETFPNGIHAKEPVISRITGLAAGHGPPVVGLESVKDAVAESHIVNGRLRFIFQEDTLDFSPNTTHDGDEQHPFQRLTRRGDPGHELLRRACSSAADEALISCNPDVYIVNAKLLMHTPRATDQQCNIPESAIGAIVYHKYFIEKIVWRHIAHQ